MSTKNLLANGVKKHVRLFFSPAGKILFNSSHGKISGENDGTAHGAHQFSALLKLCRIRKCETVYSHLLYVSRIWSVCCNSTVAINSDTGTRIQIRVSHTISCNADFSA